MNKNLVLVGTTSGIAGALMCALAGVGRVAGYFYLAGYQSTTLFNVGVGLMVLACLIKLEELLSRQRE